MQSWTEAHGNRKVYATATVEQQRASSVRGVGHRPPDLAQLQLHHGSGWDYQIDGPGCMHHPRPGAVHQKVLTSHCQLIMPPIGENRRETHRLAAAWRRRGVCFTERNWADKPTTTNCACHLVPVRVPLEERAQQANEHVVAESIVGVRHGTELGQVLLKAQIPSIELMASRRIKCELAWLPRRVFCSLDAGVSLDAFCCGHLVAGIAGWCLWRTGLDYVNLVTGIVGRCEWYVDSPGGHVAGIAAGA